MKEPHVEGLATHDDPESCVAIREGGVEALTGAPMGWVLSHEELILQGADAIAKSERRNGGHRLGEVHAGPARSEDPSTLGNLLHGNREVPGLPGILSSGPGGKATAEIRRCTIEGSQTRP